MLTLALTGLLLADLAPATPHLQLSSVSPDRLELSLCFQGGGQQVRFALQAQSISTGVAARSRQQGQLRTDTTLRCPARIRLGASESNEVRVQLRWWIDGVEQEPLERLLHVM